MTLVAHRHRELQTHEATLEGDKRVRTGELVRAVQVGAVRLENRREALHLSFFPVVFRRWRAPGAVSKHPRGRALMAKFRGWNEYRRRPLIEYVLCSINSPFHLPDAETKGL